MLDFDIKTLEKYEGNVIEPNVQADYFISPCFKVIETGARPEVTSYYKATKEQFNPDVETIDDNGIVIAKPAPAKTKEQILQEADEAFISAMKEVVIFREKPFIVNYAYDYQVIVLPSYKNDTDTKFIWDCTEKDGLELNKTELTELYDILAPKYEDAYQARKQARAEVL